MVISIGLYSFFPLFIRGIKHTYNGRNTMKISFAKDLVEFVPETDDEKEELSLLWDIVVDCVKFNKKLVPVGEYIPMKNDRARFAIEE
jgi:hypothetical protein